LSDAPKAENIKKLAEKDYGPDKYQLIGKEIYIFCYGRSSDSKLSNKIFEDKLKVKSSTRNWKTVTKLHELSRNE
jgi:uncharacterized protein (DUF1697 family)